jgi:DNA polymerase III delta prime subunit
MEHHAYVLLGEKSVGEVYLENIFSELVISPLGNPDIHFLDGDVFGVDDARRISEEAQVKAFGSKKIFVIRSSRITPEAQNALLKTFEEPPADTHFFVFARESSSFLPTLLSRMHTVRLGRIEEPRAEAEAFLDMSLAQRIVFARKFADEKEERGTSALAEFLDSLLLVLQKTKAPLTILKKIFNVRLFAEDPSAMSRLIIEHLALMLG